MKGVQRIYNDVLYFRKEHFCPACGEKLNKVTVSKIVNAKSPEAKDFDFRIGRTKMIGDVEFIWDEFECPSCKKHYTVEEIKAAEGIEDKRTVNPFTLIYIAAIIYFVLRAIKSI